MTDEIFEEIILKLKSGKLISEETKEILKAIKFDESAPQRFLLDFLNRIIRTQKYNVKIVELIEEFLSGKIDIKTMSYKLFNEGKKGYGEFCDIYDESLIRHDNLKRGLCDYIYPYEKPQFYHFAASESIFEKMIRTIFEFTRGDEPYPRGVCFDYCMFLCALDIIKEGRTRYTITCGIEKNGAINYFISDQSEVIDPFNGIYTSIDNYEINGSVNTIIPNGVGLTMNERNEEVGQDTNFKI